MTDAPVTSFWQRGLRNPWIHTLMLGFGLALLGFLVWVFVGGQPGSGPGPDPRASQQPAPSAPGAPGSSPATAAGPKEAPDLKSQLAPVFSGIREANQKKDLSLLLSHYSPNFPQLTQRAQNISRTWKIYNYLQMNFDIREARLLSPGTASARVVWEVEVQNISTLKSEKVSRTYRIKFVRESDQWRIQALDKTE